MVFNIRKERIIMHNKMSLNRPSYCGKIGKKVLDIAFPLFNHQEWVYGQFLSEWPKIIGPLSAFTRPRKIVFASEIIQGQLYLDIWGGVGLQVQHQTPFIVNKVNSYFGYQAVSRLLIKQVVHKKVEEKPKFVEVSLDSQQKKYLEDMTAELYPEELREAVLNLAIAVFKKSI